MLTRLLRTGVRLTEIGLGTAQLGNLYRSITDQQALEVLDAAWAEGIRYFDTAPHYGLGLSERRVGAGLASKPRDDYVLPTKVGRLLIDDPGGAARRDDQGFDVPAAKRRVWDFSRDGVLRSIDESLQRLGPDRIDIVYVHDADDFRDQATEQAIPALIELRGEGVVRAVGAGMNQTAVPAHFIRNSDIDVVMIAGRYTLLEQGAIEELLPLAVDAGVDVVIAGAYNSGVLAAPRPVSGATHDYAPAPQAVIERAGRIADVCERYGVEMPETAVAFPLAHPAVACVVLGAHDGHQVVENLRRYGAAVPAELWAALRAEGLLSPPSPTPDQEKP